MTMTYPTSLLMWLIAVGTLIMIACLVPRIKEEEGKSFWLMAALISHGLGALALMVAASIAQTEVKVGPVLYWLWLGWSLWFFSKTTIIYVLGQIRFALGCYAFCVIAWLTYQGFFP